jgi:hypothetical protein
MHRLPVPGVLAPLCRVPGPGNRPRCVSGCLRVPLFHHGDGFFKLGEPGVMSHRRVLQSLDRSVEAPYLPFELYGIHLHTRQGRCL